jgi:hypothetical protein
MFRPDHLDALSPQSQSGDRLPYARKFRVPEKAPFVREDSVMNPIGVIVRGVNAARYDVPEMRALISPRVEM